MTPTTDRHPPAIRAAYRRCSWRKVAAQSGLIPASWGGAGGKRGRGSRISTSGGKEGEGEGIPTGKCGREGGSRGRAGCGLRAAHADRLHHVGHRAGKSDGPVRDMAAGWALLRGTRPIDGDRSERCVRNIKG